ncbi:hypothetical protein BSKO_01345 [Bryopsis sp. KO-2023]|nr:hypothetical protein BSKO_01345 [Bryopsis sp. KO-2023]
MRSSKPLLTFSGAPIPLCLKPGALGLSTARRNTVLRSWADEPSIAPLTSLVSDVAQLGTLALIAPLPALADGVSYNPAAGDEFLTNLTGVLYVGLVGYFLYRVLGRRAKRFTEESIRGKPSSEPQKRVGEQKTVTVSDAFLGASIAGSLSVVLFFLTSNVDSLVMQAELPDQYTARNIAITLRTVVRGIFYLATFVFGLNAVGLLGLGVQIVLDPSVGEPEALPDDPVLPKLPKVSVTSDPEDIRRAFDRVSRKSKEE